MTRLATVLAMIALGGCNAGPPPDVAGEGRALFSSQELSPSVRNVFSCATCHDTAPAGDAGAIRTGAPLAGATDRASFWGGEETDLLAAINQCRSHFMLAPVPLAADSPEAQALYAFLVGLAPGDPGLAPFTIVRAIEELPRGDAAAGTVLFERTCAVCHGDAHTGRGRLALRLPVLPEETLRAHPDFDARGQRLVFIEKIRHGGFLGYGGDMPPFSAERLSDQGVSDILEFIGVLGLLGVPGG